MLDFDTTNHRSSVHSKENMGHIRPNQSPMKSPLRSSPLTAKNGDLVTRERENSLGKRNSPLSRTDQRFYQSKLGLGIIKATIKPSEITSHRNELKQPRRINCSGRDASESRESSREPKRVKSTAVKKILAKEKITLQTPLTPSKTVRQEPTFGSPRNQEKLETEGKTSGFDTQTTAKSEVQDLMHSGLAFKAASLINGHEMGLSKQFQDEFPYIHPVPYSPVIQRDIQNQEVVNVCDMTSETRQIMEELLLGTRSNQEPETNVLVTLQTEPREEESELTVEVQSESLQKQETLQNTKQRRTRKDRKSHITGQKLLGDNEKQTHPAKRGESPNINQYHSFGPVPQAIQNITNTMSSYTDKKNPGQGKAKQSTPQSRSPKKIRKKEAAKSGATKTEPSRCRPLMETPQKGTTSRIISPKIRLNQVEIDCPIAKLEGDPLPPLKLPSEVEIQQPVYQKIPDVFTPQNKETSAAGQIQKAWRSHKLRVNAGNASPEEEAAQKTEPAQFGEWAHYQEFVKGLEKDHEYKKAVTFFTLFYYFQKQGPQSQSAVENIE